MSKQRRPLSAGDLAGLKALEADRDGDAEGIPAAELRTIASTHFLPSFVSRLREHKHVIGITPDGHYHLGHNKSTSTEAPDDERPAVPPAPVGQSAGASVETEGRLFELSPTSHFRADA